MQELRENPVMLVTGASGYTGGRLVHYLHDLGIPVRALVRKSSNLEALQKLGAEIVYGDLQDKISLRKAVEGVAGIFHIAALFRQAGLPQSEFYKVNAEGTRNLFEVAIEANVKRLIHCSTTGVMNLKNPPSDESTPYGPEDMYQRSKMEAEIIALDYFRGGKIGGVVIRPAMIYGPGDTRIVKIFKMVAKKRFFYIGNGKAYVHFIDVRDLVRAFWLAMENTKLNGEVYIIAGEKYLYLKDAVEIIARELKVPPPWLHLPVKPMQWLGSLCEFICTPFRIQPPIFRRRVDFFTKHRAFDCSKAARDLGFKPERTLHEEIRDISAHHKDH